MSLVAAKISTPAQVSSKGTITPASVQSANVTVPRTIGLVIQPTSTGPPGVGANWRGIWSGATTYALGDGVQGSDGHNYISVVGSNLNHNPTSTSGFWSDLLPSSVANVVTGSSSRLPVLYAPIPTGVAAIDTPTLQTLINYAIVGSGTDVRTAPMSPSSAQAEIKLAAGSYAINAPLKIYSVQGLRLEGAGQVATQLAYTGTGTIPTILDVNGSSFCEIGKFNIQGGASATNYPVTGLNIDAVSTVASGSSQGCHWYDLLVQGTWVDGIVYGGSGPTLAQDVFRHLFTHVTVIGSQPDGTWNTPTLWQNCFRLGKSGGTPANVLHPHLVNCSVGGSVNGVAHYGCGGVWNGGAFEGNGTDIQNLGSGIISYRGVRGEGSGALMAGTGSTNSPSVTLEDIAWYSHIGFYPAQSVLTCQSAGPITIRGVSLKSDDNDTAANMQVTVGGSSVLEISGLVIQRNDQKASPKAWLVTNGAQCFVRNVRCWTTNGTGAMGTTFAGPMRTADWKGVNTTYQVIASDENLFVDTVPVTITLEAITGTAYGRQLLIKDETGTAGASNITVQRAGADLFEDGTTSKVINTNFGYLRVYHSGNDKWGVIT